MSVRGLIYFGFPLHAAGKPSADRGQHLFDIKLPMLFLQGSRDALADLKLLKPLCARLGKRVELFVIEGGDHSFHLLKSSGRSDDQALDEAATEGGFLDLPSPRVKSPSLYAMVSSGRAELAPGLSRVHDDLGRGVNQ